MFQASERELDKQDSLEEVENLENDTLKRRARDVLVDGRQLN